IMSVVLTDRVKIFQRKTEWIHDAVTAHTSRLRTVLFDSLPYSFRRLTRSVFSQWFDIRRWRCRRRAEKALQYPGATQHGRGAIRISGQIQDGAFAQEAIACRVLQCHSTKVATFNVLDAVGHCQPFIEKRVVRRQQFDDAMVAAQNAVDEQPQFFLEQRARIQEAARLREQSIVGSNLVELGDVEPLERKIVDQRLCSLVSKHAANLFGQHFWLAEARPSGEVE